MIYSLVLATHIVVACVSIATLIYTGYALLKESASRYSGLGVAIAALAAVESATGVLLVALSPEVSILKVGLHLALYLGVCMLAEGALVLRARQYGLAK